MRLTRREAVIGGLAAGGLAGGGLAAGGLAGGGLASGGLAAGALGVEAAAAQPGGAEQLERLLALEQRLAVAYRAALERDAIEPALGRMLLAHERNHVRGIEIALRAVGRRRPQVGVAPPGQGAALTSRPAFARFALGLEGETVAAYPPLLATLGSPGLLQPLGSIMAAGVQHQVALRAVLGEDLLAP